MALANVFGKLTRSAALRRVLLAALLAVVELAAQLIEERQRQHRGEDVPVG